MARPLAAGDQLDGRYRLQQVAGAGGMATVWRAHDERLDRTVAIKLLSDSPAVNLEAVMRFACEARTHAGIHHPNLVELYDYSIATDHPYLVMEYIDGVTLSERLDRGGSLETPAFQQLANELLSAIACVHDHGVLHRDIKPANVLIDRDGRARLMDFGVARLQASGRGLPSSHTTEPNDKIVGTLRFLAPELLESGQPTRRTDLYALGVMLRIAVGESDPGPQIEKLIAWLTHPHPEARPRDAHAALAHAALAQLRRAARP